jgi:hypothetical protein
MCLGLIIPQITAARRSKPKTTGGIVGVFMGPASSFSVIDCERSSPKSI